MNSRKRIAIAAIAAAGLVAPLGLTMGAAHADSDLGYIIGTVTDGAGHPLAGATVYAQSSTSGSAYGYTDHNGRYVAVVDRSDAATPGPWTIQASDGDFTSSTPVAVTTPVIGQNVAGPTIALTAAPYTAPTTGLVLTGTVTTPTGVATSGYVEAYDAATGAPLTDSNLTDIDSYQIHSDGHYYVTVDDPAGYSDSNDYKDENLTGSVKLQFYVPGYTATWNGGGLVKSAAPAINVPAYGAAAASVNGSVGAQGTVTGTVKLPAAGANWTAQATILDLDGNEVGSSSTDAAGNFSADVAPGTYYVRADGYRFTEWTAPGSTTPERADYFGFVAGYYGKHATSLASATKIVVTANGVKNVGTITLTNALHATAKPVIKAKKGVKKGAKLKVSTGTWNHQADVIYSYAWKVGKKTVGHQATLKLTKKVWKKKLKNGKKIKKLTVTVTATDKNGQLVNGSVKQKVEKTLTKQAKQLAKAAKKAQQAADKASQVKSAKK